MILELQQKYPGSIQYITSFNFKNWGKPNFTEDAIDQIKRGLSSGAVGVKIWKDLGFDLRDKKSSFVMMDDPVFNSIFDYLVKNDILQIGHQGEPRNCWLTLNNMTVDSDRKYFEEHPEYRMYLQKEYPSYEDQMPARYNMLIKFPDLRYVGLHLFSMEWSIEKVAKKLETYPNSLTDVAERVCHLQLQAKNDLHGVRDFCIKYQGRIMYGTDVIDDGRIPSEEIERQFEHLWNFHYKFLATAETLEAPEFKGAFKGLDLPEEVVEKIFYSNAKKPINFKNTT